MISDFENEGEYECPEAAMEARADSVGERVDVFCARAFGLTRSQAQRAIASGHAALNGQPAKASDKLRQGDLDHGLVAAACERPSIRIIA